MPEINGIEVHQKRPEKVVKARPSIHAEKDPLRIFAQIRRNYGRELTMHDIEELLADRRGA